MSPMEERREISIYVTTVYDEVQYLVAPRFKGRLQWMDVEPELSNFTPNTSRKLQQHEDHQHHYTRSLVGSRHY